MYIANINDSIKVKLTVHGRDILYTHVANTHATIYYHYNPDEDGYIKFTLWEFMQIFGSHLWNSCKQVIEQNEIIFLPPQPHVKELYDEWSNYVRDCLEDKCFQFLSFPIWLASVKKLSEVEVDTITDVINSERIKKI